MICMWYVIFIISSIFHLFQCNSYSEIFFYSWVVSLYIRRIKRPYLFSMLVFMPQMMHNSGWLARVCYIYTMHNSRVVSQNRRIPATSNESDLISSYVSRKNTAAYLWWDQIRFIWGSKNLTILLRRLVCCSHPLMFCVWIVR